MDIKYKNEFEFLDLSGLDERDKVEINLALNSGAATEVLQLPWDTGEETDYYEADVSLETGDNQTWQTYDAEPSQVSYEGEMEASGVGVIRTMPTPQVYPHPPPPMMASVCSGMLIPQPNIYANEMGQELSMHQYVSAVDYQQSIYIQPTERHDISMGRDNRRRNHRGRGSKRDPSSRYMDLNNEMGAVYHPVQGQYQRLPRNICPQTFYYQTEQSNHQRQRPYHPGPTSYTQPHPRAVYQQVYPGGSNQYSRHVPPVAQTPRQRNEAPKHSIKRGNEPIPRPAASTYGPPPLSIQRKSSESINSSQTNIDYVTTVIVNNSNSNIEHSVNNVSSNEGSSESNTNATATTTTTTTTKYLSNNNKIIDDSDSSSNVINSSSSNKVPPVNLTIEHNIVATVNKGCELSEKTDRPYVNINSSIQVKQQQQQQQQQQQKTEISTVEIRKETVSVVQTSSLPEVEKQPPLIKEEKPEEIIVQSNTEEIIVESKESESLTPQVATESTGKSWASILKKSNTESFASGITNGKPTARINPLRIDVPSDSETVNKSISKIKPRRNRQGKSWPFSNADNSANESTISNPNEPQEQYDSSNKFDDLDAQKIGEFLLKYQMDKQTVSLLPRGLINRNNYCYINSILQALLACPPFYNLLVALPYSKNPSRNDTSNNLTTNMIRFVHEFSRLSDGARLTRKDRPPKRNDEAVVNVQSGFAFEPSYVYTMLKNTSCATVFSVEGRQEDAEEFLSCLLNGISDEMLEMMKLGNTENPPPAAESEPVQSNNGGEQEEWKVMGPKNKGSITRCTDFGRTPLSDIFRGQLRYKVSRAGEESTDNVQPFFTLQLDIEKAVSVKGALEILVGRDQLEGMTCSKTKREIEAWKQVTLEELPVILILHLKWFDYKLDGCSKILKSVEFPIDLKMDGKILSANTFKKLSPKQKQYKLFAVTYHDGKEATKGHYVTDAFHVGYGGWVRYDDSTVRGVSEHNVLNPLPPRVPYLLYYRRCDTIGNNQLNSNKRNSLG